MDPESSIVAVGVGLCLLVLAFTSAVDAAFISISRHRLSAMLAEGTPRARTISRLMEDPYRFKATLILLNSAMTIAAAGLTLYLARNLSVGLQIGSLALLLLGTLILSEVIPKSIVLRNPDATALWLARPISVTIAILWPLIALLDLLINPLVSVLSGKPVGASPLVTEEELRLLVNVGEKEGLIEHEEREMIEGIFSFNDTLVREIMVPRVDIAAVEITSSLDDALDLVITRGHSRIPVFDETIDTVVGLLYAKDVLTALRNDKRDTSLSALVRPAYFIPETMKVGSLLRDLQSRKVHMAIVVDEYGGTAGLATIENLLEEIVGDIQDEYDTEEAGVTLVSEGELLADDRVPINEINELTGLELESDESDRIGGFVYERLGRVPRVGDVVELPGTNIEVISVQGLRPRQMRITYHRPEELILNATDAKGEVEDGREA